jgi:hypothetical protein
MGLPKVYHLILEKYQELFDLEAFKTLIWGMSIMSNNIKSEDLDFMPFISMIEVQIPKVIFSQDLGKHSTNDILDLLSNCAIKFPPQEVKKMLEVPYVISFVMEQA